LQLGALKFDEKEFTGLLAQMIACTENLQNAPALRLTPQEDLIVDLVVAFLAPYTQPKGPLIVRKITYKPGRSNCIIELPADSALAKQKGKEKNGVFRWRTHGCCACRQS